MALSASAARRIADAGRKPKARPEARLRVSVSGGGCSGFQYHFALDDKSEDGDVRRRARRRRRRGRRHVADVRDRLRARLVEDLTGSYFRVKNPNASSSCGCGTSFAI